jgi:M-phase inducer tyrosine phosphatase
VVQANRSSSAKFIRGEDRASNAHQYPKLTYPEIYILDGGYSSFFKDYKARCYPQNYVEMNDKEYTNACERGLGRIKQQRTKLGRAQTFAFGQHSPGMEESPTAVNRQQCSNLMLSMDISLDESLDSAKRIGTRRMASF